MTKKLRNTILIILGALLAVSLSLTFFACQDDNSYAEQPEELKYRYSYELKVFAEPDAFMSVDGKLDEAIWQNQIPHINSVDGVTISTKTVFTEKGLYVGVLVSDGGIYYTTDYNMDKNSSVKITVCPVSMIMPVTDRDMITVEIDTKYLRSNYVIRYAYGSSVQSGKVNDEDSFGLGVEFFLPWSEVDFTETVGARAEQVRVSASYNKVTGADMNATNRWINPGYQQEKPSLCYVFDENGYTQQDAVDSVMGDSFSGTSKTGGWDLTNAENGVYHTVGNNNQWLFFKDVCAENYIIQARIKIVGGINDALPRVGLLIGRNETMKNALLIDARSSYVASNRTQFKVLTQAGTSWVLGNTLYDDNAFSITNGFNLKVIKNGSTLYYVVNDVYMGSDTLLGMAGETEPGLYSVGCEAYFSNVSCSVFDINKQGEAADFKAEIEKYTNVIELPENLLGGSIESDFNDVTDGGTVKLYISLNPGYVLEKFEINGKDTLENLRENIDGNVYTLTDVCESMKINAVFTKLTNVKLYTVKGKIDTSDGLFEKQATVTFVDKTDPLRIYMTSANQKTGYTMRLPEGEYDIKISLDGYASKTESFVLEGKTLERETITLISSKGLPLNARVTLSNGEALSGTIDYDYFGDGSVVGATAGHGYSYLKDAYGERVVVEASINLVSNPTDSDPSAGFTFSTASDADSYGFTVLCYKNGVRVGNIGMLKNGTSGWGENLIGIGSTTFLDSKNGQSIRLTVVRDYADYYVFLNEIFVKKYTVDYTEGETAVGFYTAGCNARFSDYDWSLDSDVIDEWIEFSKIDPYNTVTFIDGARFNGQNSFAVQTELYLQETQSGASASTAGFYFCTADEKSDFAIYLSKDKIYLGRTKVNEYSLSSPINFSSTNKQNAAKLKVVKYLDNYYVFVNDTFVYVSQNGMFLNSQADVLIALRANGMKAGFVNTVYTAETDAVMASLKGILPTEKTIDGDLSDWNESNWSGTQAETVRLNAVSANNSSGDSFNAMAYLGADGVYLAIKIEHTLAYKSYDVTDSSWWNYSYVAFFLNGTSSATMKNSTLVSSVHQNRLLSGYTYGNVIAQFVTRQTSDKYVTTIEVFVPWSICDNYSDYLAGDALRMGFDCNMGTGMLRPHGGPDEINNQYYLTANGLVLTLLDSEE